MTTISNNPTDTTGCVMVWFGQWADFEASLVASPKGYIYSMDIIKEIKSPAGN